MLRSFRKCFAALSILAPTAFFSCGEAETREIINDLKVNFTNQLATLDVEFSGDITLNVEFSYPVADYGFVTFVPSTETEGFRIIASLDLSIFEDLRFQVDRTQFLPNGVPFPSYVGTEMATYRMKSLDRFGALLYLGIEETNRFIGSSVELAFIDEDFPAGLTISQKWVEEDTGEVLGVATLYGPKFDGTGNMIAPGGLFAATNLSNLIGGVVSEDGTTIVNNPRIKTSELEINAPGQELSPRELKELYELFLKKGRAAGIIQ